MARTTGPASPDETALETVEQPADDRRSPVLAAGTRELEDQAREAVRRAQTVEDEDVAAALKHDPKVLVERAVVGREIETAVLGTPDGPRTSLPGEIVTGGEHSFYDFDAKYLDEAHVQLICPADLPEEVSNRVRAMAEAAFTAVGAESLARVDVFVGEDGTVTVNEINTMPGFTPTSMYPRMWAATGMDYPRLVSTLLETALSRPLGLR